MSETSIHATAVVDAGAIIGPGTRIWHFTHVSATARVGARCSLGQNVFVADGVTIGDGVKIQNNVSLYTGVTLEDYVFCGPSCVFTNVVNPRSEIVRRTEYKETRVQRGASLGANCTIVCGITIGRYAFAGAGAVVTRDVPDYALVLGAPARIAGWMSRHGHRLEEQPDGSFRCPGSGWRYVRSGAGLACLDHDEDTPL